MWSVGSFRGEEDHGVVERVDLKPGCGSGTEEWYAVDLGWGVEVRREGDGAQGHFRTSALRILLCWRRDSRENEVEG